MSSGSRARRCLGTKAASCISSPGALAGDLEPGGVVVVATGRLSPPPEKGQPHQCGTQNNRVLCLVQKGTAWARRERFSLPRPLFLCRTFGYFE